MQLVNGQLECCEFLINHGANVNEKDKDGSTPLHLAAWNGKLECCEFLINHGVNVNEKDSDGNTPLHLAACEWTIRML